MPLNCWKNIRPNEMDNGFRLHFFINCDRPLDDACRSASLCVLMMPFSSGSTSACLPRNHCNALRACSSRPRDTNQRGVSGISSMDTMNGMASEQPRKARPDQFNMMPAPYEIRIPIWKEIILLLLNIYMLSVTYRCCRKRLAADRVFRVLRAVRFRPDKRGMPTMQRQCKNRTAHDPPEPCTRLWHIR